ncbi:hypothetical protein SAMN05428946_1573 [Edaphobacillus lindanitolerans]|uniref:Uncharacterized protein n=1 Tax=Edaphobacillus lindanitolerans TaxID=550447 RepID=A0A1U7PQ77_9BACI|nr:hypothetical protein SAMN05428946_1573 [Edaphobacillus lindanitolerans]
MATCGPLFLFGRCDSNPSISLKATGEEMVYCTYGMNTINRTGC